MQEQSIKKPSAKAKYYAKPIEVEMGSMQDPTGLFPRPPMTSNILYTTDKCPSMNEVNFVVYDSKGVKKTVNKVEYRKLMAQGDHYESSWLVPKEKKKKETKEVVEDNG